MATSWRPLGATAQFRTPEVGALIGYDHAVWRVREINPIPEIDWDGRDRDTFHLRSRPPMAVVVRPVDVEGDDPKLRGRDLHLKARPSALWHVYPNEHYPVCAQCAEPMPCRERVAIEESERAAERMARYEIAGVCPACSSPVTQRQGSRTFDENLYMPGGPPVTFHAGKRECWSGLIRYEDVWVAADPENRKRRYRCDGTLTTHSTTEYECTQGADCPGPQAGHMAITGCQCPWHQSRCYQLAKDAQNIALEPPQGGGA